MKVRVDEGTPTERPITDAAVQIIVRFNDALNARDVDAMMHLMADDCVFENTEPAPDGTRYEGQQSIRAFWEEFFRSSREPRIEVEEIFALGERCVMRWTYRWVNAQGKPGHVRSRRLQGTRRTHCGEALLRQRMRVQVSGVKSVFPMG